MQPETEPQEGISTSPNTLRPTQILCTYQQHMAYYLSLMVKPGISLPRGMTGWFHLSLRYSLLYSLLHASFYPASDPLPSLVHHCFFLSSKPSRKFLWLITYVVWQSYCTLMFCSNWRLPNWDLQQ